MNPAGISRTDPEKDSHQRAVFLLSAVCLLMICGGWVYCLLHPYQPAGWVVVDTVNPNLDPAASLLRLPNIGPSRAQAILEYRSAFLNRPAFEKPGDLAAVHGIGPVTVGRIAPYLSFETETKKE